MSMLNYTLIETVKNATNYTKEDILTEFSGEIIIFLRMLTISTQIFIMVSMGSIISLKEIVNHIKQPLSVIIALVSQFIALPLCSFGIINLLQLSPTNSVAALILACCPGGSISNLFTYFCDGDVPLSITLTTISTTFALGFMPLNLWIYARTWTDNQTLKVPYVGIVITLALILIPLIIGMLMKKYLPKVAVIVNKICSVLGLITIVTYITLQNILDPKSFAPSKWKFWLVAIAISIGGFFAGLLMSLISRRPSKHVKTIAIETGMQSVSLALTVLLTSFPQNLHNEMTCIPIMNGIFILVAGICLALSVKIGKRCSSKNMSCTEPNYKLVCTITK